jgi:hypothetical protein
LPLLGGARPTASAFFAAIWRVGHRVFTWRAGHGGFTLPGHEFAEFRESRDHQNQRKSAADDPNSNLDRKRVCDTDAVAKKINQLFHLSFSAMQVSALFPEG